jgi:hypothetical protein
LARLLSGVVSMTGPLLTGSLNLRGSPPHPPTEPTSGLCTEYRRIKGQEQ